MNPARDSIFISRGIRKRNTYSSANEYCVPIFAENEYDVAGFHEEDVVLRIIKLCLFVVTAAMAAFAQQEPAEEKVSTFSVRT